MTGSTRIVTPVLPTEVGTEQGLAYSLWLPERDMGEGAERATGGSSEPATAGVVILHGAGSCKENHHDFARAALGSGLAAVAFDQRGHGAGEGALDDRVLDDVAAITALLRQRIGDADAPVALRGSSMGGYLALVAARAVRARAVVAICPASAEGLRRGLASQAFTFRADALALDSFLATHDLDDAVQVLDIPVLLLHAEGDEQVPVQQSRELAARLRSSESRLLTVPGGHHRSVQHDPELQALSLRWLTRVLATPGA